MIMRSRHCTNDASEVTNLTGDRAVSLLMKVRPYLFGAYGYHIVKRKVKYMHVRLYSCIE